MTTATNLQAMFDKGDYEQILKLHGLETKNADLLYYAGLVYQKHGNHKKCINLWDQGIRLNHVPSIRGSVHYYKEINPTVAKDLLEKLEEMDVSTCADMVLLGNLYMKSEDFDASHYCYMVALELDPDDSTPLVQLAELHSKWGLNFAEQAKKVR